VKIINRVVGYTLAKVYVCNPKDEFLKEELELLVDTGSTYTWIRRENLQNWELRVWGGEDLDV